MSTRENTDAVQIEERELDTVQGGLPAVQKARESARVIETGQAGAATRPTIKVATFQCPTDHP